MDVRNLSGRLALVTGAGSGIGRQTALALARRGADLVLCDVDADGLADTAAGSRALGRNVLARRVDVASAEAMAAFAAEVHRARPAVDILVNNAGVGLGGALVDTTLVDWGWVIGVNLWGVIHGCHFFVPPMIDRGTGGHIVNVSSAAGLLASATLLAYSTTKFAVFGLSEALREELAPHGIGVTTICPGIINTPITARARLRGAAAAPGAREALVAFYQRRNYGPERVADAIVTAIGRNTAVRPVAPEAWVFYCLKRLSPGLAARLSRWSTARLERELARAVDKRRSPG